MEKILTIVVPTYNMEKYLDKCLTSLIIEDRELLKRVEVLVIIDGATDRSSEIAHTYQDRFPETFRVIDKENGNYGSCVNRGLKEATGKYIKILDADDWFDTKVFERYIREIENFDVDLVLNDMHSFMSGCEDKMLYNLASFFKENCVHRFEELLEINNTARYIAMHCIAYKTKNLRCINYSQTEGISYTDLEWDVIPMQTVLTFASIQGYLYIYQIGREGQTVDPNVQKKSMNQLSQTLKRLIVFMEKYIPKDAFYDYMQRMLMWHVYDLYGMTYDKNIRDNVIKSLDEEIRIIATKVYKEMDIWSFDVCGFNIKYVAAIRHPWMELSNSLLKEGYRGFDDLMDYLTRKKLIKPELLVTLYYGLKSRLNRLSLHL